MNYLALLFLLTTSLYAYTPVYTPNGKSLDWTLDGDVKVFRLVAEPVEREFAPGLVVNCWGYNGQTPGPTIEAVEGDKVRILVTNKLKEPTSVHWHGILLPSGMDGVSGLSQKPIPVGETCTYEFTLKNPGTHMYHSHFDEMTQIALGMMGFFIIHPKEESEEEKVDRDFCIMLHEWFIPIGAKTPDPMVMLDFNYFTFNSTLWPKTEPLVVKKGQKVRIRLGNLSMDSHPIHLHGYEFTVVAQGAKRLKLYQQYDAVTINVPVGDTREIEFIADTSGDWAFHCHKSHHVMNGMEHNIPNFIGADLTGLKEKVEKLFPDAMPLSQAKMGEMLEMPDMKMPKNLAPMSAEGPFGPIGMGGMFTVLKVREGIANYTDPGWYKNPPGTVATSQMDGREGSKKRAL